MFSHIKLIKQLCSGHRIARILMILLAFFTTICVMNAITPPLMGQARHRAWRHTGVDNAAYFTDAFRFAWPGEGAYSPPAYDKLIKFLYSLNGCTPCSVDYASIQLEEQDSIGTLRIYPEPLRKAINTPMSEGVFSGATEYPDCLPIVLDYRLRNHYSIGDYVNINCEEVENIPAVVTGFLNIDNDHLSTHGGSNAKLFEFIASKALAGDPYVIIAASHPLLSEKPFMGGRKTIILLPPSGESVNDYIEGWREAISVWNLGQIDTYSEILRSETWEMAVVANMDLFMLSAWLVMLTIISLFGYCLMQSNLWSRRIAVYGMIGMSRIKMLVYIAIGGYGYFWLTTIVSLAIGNCLIGTMYADIESIRVELNVLAFAVSAFPHCVALFWDSIRILRNDSLKIWNSRR